MAAMSAHADSTRRRLDPRPRRSASNRTRSPSPSASASVCSRSSPASCRRSPSGRTTTKCTASVFIDIPGPLQLAFYTVIPVMIIWGGFMFANRMKNWERGAPVEAAHDHQERRPAAQGLPRRRLHADAPARLRRRAHALDDLLRVPRAPRRHHGARGRPPDARGSQVPPGRRLPGVRVRRRRGRASCSSAASCGRSCVATSSGRTASGSSRSRNTSSSSARSSRSA